MRPLVRVRACERALVAFALSPLLPPGARGVAVPLAMVAGEQLLACPGQCGQSFTRSRLVFHLRSHTCAAAAGGPLLAVQKAAEIAAAANAVPPAADAGPLLCPVPECGHSSPNLKALRKHHAAVHAEAKHICNRCGAKFGRSDALSRHIKAHSQTAQLACVCVPGTTFTTAFNLSRHIKERTEKYPGERHERLRKPAEEEGGAAGAQTQACSQQPADADADAAPLPPMPLAGAEFNLLDL